MDDKSQIRIFVNNFLECINLKKVASLEKYTTCNLITISALALNFVCCNRSKSVYIKKIQLLKHLPFCSNKFENLQCRQFRKFLQLRDFFKWILFYFRSIEIWGKASNLKFKIYFMCNFIKCGRPKSAQNAIIVTFG